MHCLNIYIYISEWFPNNLSLVQAFKGPLLSIVSNYRFDKLKDAFAGMEAQLSAWKLVMCFGYRWLR